MKATLSSLVEERAASCVLLVCAELVNGLLNVNLSGFQLCAGEVCTVG